LLRGLRFQKRLRVLPGVRINLSKSGASTSIGPRGGDGNIGPPSANAGIPGSGLSTRAKLSKPHSALIGVAVLAVGLGFAAYKNMDRIAAWLAPAPVAQQIVQPSQPVTAAAPARQAAAASRPKSIRAQAAELLVAGGTIYVRRGGSVLRETEKTSGTTLKKLDKGAAVTVVALDDEWTKVNSGGVIGWMRTSVLGPKP